MKTLILCVLIATTGKSALAQYRNIELQAAGLTCSMCSNAINKALKTLPFIEDIKTDLSNNRFQISLKTGLETDFDLIQKKVENAGFSVAKMTVEARFDHLEVANDTHLVLGGKALHFLHVKNQQLEGWKTIQLVDKGFVFKKEFSKMQSYTNMACFKTGYAEACCSNTKKTASPITSGQRIYHVTL